jgi:hypothetical protein
MNPRILAIVTLLVAASVVWVPSPVLARQRAPQRAQVIKAAPIFLVPDASRAPLRIAEEGTWLTVLSVRKEWLEVEWQDRQYGPRVGYVRAEFVRLYSDRSAPAAATPPTPEPLQVVPLAPTAPGATPPSQPATAQKPVSAAGRWADRGYISISGVYQTGAKAFSESFTFDQYVEQASVSTEYPAKDQPGFDVGGAVRVWRGLALGVGVTVVNWSTSANIAGAIPHPFFFNASRPISGSASVKRTETAVHLHALWFVPMGQKILVAVGGGPSYFNVKQSLVQSVSFTETYPYDTATFASASVNQPSTWALGYGAEVDVGFYFTRILGVGGGVRFTRASVALAGPSGSVNRDAGGFQGGVGLRIRLRPPAPKKPPLTPPTPPRM